jgi:hypothetical protein
VERSDSKELANDARSEMNSILKRLSGRVEKAEKYKLRGELNILRKEVRAFTVMTQLGKNLRHP